MLASCSRRHHADGLVLVRDRTCPGPGLISSTLLRSSALLSWRRVASAPLTICSGVASFDGRAASRLFGHRRRLSAKDSTANLRLAQRSRLQRGGGRSRPRPWRAGTGQPGRLTWLSGCQLGLCPPPGRQPSLAAWVTASSSLGAHGALASTGRFPADSGGRLGVAHAGITVFLIRLQGSRGWEPLFKAGN